MDLTKREKIKCPVVVQHPVKGGLGFEVAGHNGLERVCTDIDEDSAHRIAACLNYFDGVSTEDIKAMNPRIDDPRLSDDPLTALAAVMRHHSITIELDHEYDMSSVTILQDKKELYYLERDNCVGFITANDIKPEK